MTPIISEGNKVSDIYSRLLQDRIIFIDTEITDAVASVIVAQLLYLSSVGKDDITIYLNTPGGSVAAGLAIYDTIQRVKQKCDVATVCLGMAASMGSILLCAGTHGKRKVMPHGTVMIHQASTSGGMVGKCSDVQVAAKEMARTENVLVEILAKHSKLTKTVLRKRMLSDTWYSANEAVKVGLADSIIS